MLVSGITTNLLEKLPRKIDGFVIIKPEKKKLTVSCCLGFLATAATPQLSETSSAGNSYRAC